MKLSRIFEARPSNRSDLSGSRARGAPFLCSVSAACQGDCGLDAQPYKRERVIEVKPYLVTAARTRNTQPTIPKSKLTIQNRGFFVSAEIAAIAIAIWNMVTPRANTSCL